MDNIVLLFGDFVSYSNAGVRGYEQDTKEMIDKAWKDAYAKFLERKISRSKNERPNNRAFEKRL
jgi:hypothetical protein